MTLEFAGAATPLIDADIAAAAQSLGLEVAVIAAVAEVESAGGGFLPDRRPKILFERHIFSRRTAHRFDATHSDISNPTRGGYGAPGANQYVRLHRAINVQPLAGQPRIDEHERAAIRQAALESASWGKFQIMGFNAELCGWPNVEAFVVDMAKSEAQHLDAFIGFCHANDLIRHLATHDWRKFTASYNGTGNVDVYSQKLATAYRRHAAAMPPSPPLPAMEGGSSPIDDIRSAQRKLMAAGLLKKRSGAPATAEDIDGDPGDMTRAAARAWRAAHPGR